MNCTIMRYFVVLILFLLAQLSKAQTEGQEMLSEFSIVQEGYKIRVFLTIEAGTSSCQGIDLERKVGNEDFNVIYSIPGICGGSEFAESYILFDELPKDGEKLSYRVNLGNVGRSEVLEIYYIPLQEGIAIYPNPALDIVNILLDKNYGVECEIEVVSSLGNIVFSVEKWIQPSISIQCSTWSKGNYTVKISSSNRDWVKQFVVH
jgi:hypothetical protein